MYPSLIERATPLLGVVTYIRIFQAVLHMLQIPFNIQKKYNTNPKIPKLYIELPWPKICSARAVRPE